MSIGKYVSYSILYFDLDAKVIVNKNKMSSFSKTGLYEMLL